jgi:hypothetical protein
MKYLISFNESFIEKKHLEYCDIIEESLSKLYDFLKYLMYIVEKKQYRNKFGYERDCIKDISSIIMEISISLTLEYPVVSTNSKISLDTMIVWIENICTVDNNTVKLNDYGIAVIADELSAKKVSPKDINEVIHYFNILKGMGESPKATKYDQIMEVIKYEVIEDSDIPLKLNDIGINYISNSVYTEGENLYISEYIKDHKMSMFYNVDMVFHSNNNSYDQQDPKNNGQKLRKYIESFSSVFMDNGFILNGSVSIGSDLNGIQTLRFNITESIS